MYRVLPAQAGTIWPSIRQLDGSYRIQPMILDRNVVGKLDTNTVDACTQVGDLMFKLDPVAKV